METNSLIIVALFTIASFLYLAYFLRKQKKGRANYVEPTKKKAIKRKINDLVFDSFQERKNYLIKLTENNEFTIITWFEDDKISLKEKLSRAGKVVLVKMFYELSSTDSYPSTPLVIWGHHPLLKEEDKFLMKIGQMDLIYLSSLDDELMHFFGSSKVKRLLEKFGHQEGEPLEHSLITASIRKAQEDLDKRVLNPISASSATKWFELNVSEH